MSVATASLPGASLSGAGLPVATSVRPGGVEVPASAGAFEARSAVDFALPAGEAVAVEWLNVWLERILALDREIAARQAEQLTLIEAMRSTALSATGGAVFGDGVLAERALRFELAAARRMTEAAVDRDLGLASALWNDLPATHDALAAGALSLRHAAAIADELTGVPPLQRRELETVALRDVDAETPTLLARRLRRLRERRCPDQAAERHRDALRHRSVTVTPGRDGMAWLTAHLAAEDAIAIHGRLDDTARSLRTTGDTDTIEHGLAATRADTLVALLLGDAPGHASGESPDRAHSDHHDLRTTARRRRLRSRAHRIRPTVLITIPADTLLGGNDPAELIDHGPIDATTARHLIQGATELRTLITDPGTGAPLRLGRRRTVTRALRDVLRTRDHHCTAPGCNHLTRGADHDHLQDWAHGGDTVPDKLATECRGHHTLKTAGILHAEHPPDTPDGTIHWRTPLGRHYRTTPPGHAPSRPTPTTWNEPPPF